MFGKLRLQSEGRGTSPFEHFSQHTLPRGFVCPVRTLFFGRVRGSQQRGRGRRQSSPCAENPQLEIRWSEICDQKLRDASARKMFDFGSNIFDVSEKPALT